MIYGYGTKSGCRLKVKPERSFQVGICYGCKLEGFTTIFQLEGDEREELQKCGCMANLYLDDAIYSCESIKWLETVDHWTSIYQRKNIRGPRNSWFLS